MANVEIGPSGRLIQFVVVPPELEEEPAKRLVVDWSRFIAETGIDPATLRPLRPKWRVPVDSDEKVAWKARYPEQRDVAVRVEAASHHGRPVWFSVIPPWQKADRVTFVGAPGVWRAGQAALAVIGFFSVWGALFLARRNLRCSRGDRKGAFRLALFIIVLVFLNRSFRVDHVWDIADEKDIFGQVVSEAIVAGFVVWLIYLAIEPYFRRRWPRLLIAWTRLLAGRFRDPMIGRDALIGAVAGCACAVIAKLAIVAPAWIGKPPLPPIRTYFTALTELRHVVFLLLNNLQAAAGMAIIAAFLFLLLHIITRSTIAATVLLCGFFLLVSVTQFSALQMAVEGALAVVTVLVFRRYGLLALAALLSFRFIVLAAPMTLDTSAWYFGRSFVVMALMTAIAAYAFWIALAAQPVFDLRLLEEE